MHTSGSVPQPWIGGRRRTEVVSEGPFHPQRAAPWPAWEGCGGAGTFSAHAAHSFAAASRCRYPCYSRSGRSTGRRLRFAGGSPSQVRSARYEVGGRQGTCELMYSKCHLSGAPSADPDVSGDELHPRAFILLDIFFPFWLFPAAYEAPGTVAQQLSWNWACL